MESKHHPTVSRVTADSPQQQSPASDQDALTRLIGVLTNIESANADEPSDIIRISRSDLQLIRSLVDFCVRQARVRGVLDQLIHEKDRQLQWTRHQLDTSQRTVVRLKTLLETQNATSRSSPTVGTVVRSATDTEAVTTHAHREKDISTAKKFPVEAVSSRISLPRSDLEADALASDETVRTTVRQPGDECDRKMVEQSNSRFHAKMEFGRGRARELTLPETGASSHLTVVWGGYTDKVVQQNIRLKKMLRDLITQRHGSVAQFLVRISVYYKSACSIVSVCMSVRLYSGRQITGRVGGGAQL